MISCVIPHYKHEQWLMKAVYGILNQTCKRYHVFILNDEPGLDLSYFLDIDYSNITVQQDGLNKGQSARWNEGIRLADDYDPGITRFIDFHGADDVSMPHRYQVFSKYFDEYDVIYSNAISLDGGDKCSMIKSEEFDYELLKNRNYIVQTTAMVRTEIAIQAKFNEEVKYGEDWLYWCALGQITKKWKYIDTPTVYYRNYSSGIGVRNGDIMAWQNEKKNLRERIRELYG